MKMAISTVTLLILFNAIGQKNMMNPEDLPEMGEFGFSGQSIVLPLTSQGGHPKVRVDLDDGESYPFIVDTGASVNVIDSAIARKMSYAVVGETQIGAPGGKQVPGKIVRVPEFRVAGATVVNAEFVVMDINGFSMGTMQGVLGLKLFENYLLTFDLANGQILVAKDQLSADAPGVIAFNDENGKIEVDVDVAGTRVPSHIDTGSMGEFVMPAALIDSLPLDKVSESGTPARLIGGARNIKYAQLEGDIRFAIFNFENPMLAFMDPSPGSGNIGSGVFGQHQMAIDQKNRLISFTRSTGRKMTVTGKRPRRLGLGFRGFQGQAQWVVATVVPGSLAAKAGFKTGDELVSLNGVPAEDYDMGKFGTLFGSSTPLNFVVERDGDLIKLEIS